MSVEFTISPSAITSKGGLLVNNGTSLVELPVGSNGQVLTATSTATNGIAWLNSSYSSTAYISIASGTTTAEVSEILISGITGSYNNFALNIHGSAVSVNVSCDILINLNSDSTASNYNVVGLSVRTAAFASNTDWAYGSFKIYNAVHGTNSFITDSRSSTFVLISNASSTSQYKQFFARANSYSNWVGATANRLNFANGIWKSTSAITSMSIRPISGAFRTGLIYSLYGF